MAGWERRKKMEQRCFNSPLFGELWSTISASKTDRQPPMKRSPFILATAFIFHTSFAATPLPKDVSDFRALAEQCEHFASEQDSVDEQQQKALDASLEATCGKAVVQLKTLREKYKNDEVLMKVINAYDF